MFQNACTAGLLHDFGKILLLYNQPDVALAAFQPGAGPRPPVEEEAIFGYSLQVITQALALHMKLPEPLFRALMDLYREGQGERAVTPGVLLRVASLAATWLRYGFDEPLRNADEPLSADWALTAQLFGYVNAEVVWQTVEQASGILRDYVDAYF